MIQSHHERQPSGSFLVRFWSEPREADGQPEIVRVYVRNLRTGEERYVGDPASLGEVLQRDLRETFGEAKEAGGAGSQPG